MQSVNEWSDWWQQLCPLDIYLWVPLTCSPCRGRPHQWCEPHGCPGCGWAPRWADRPSPWTHCALPSRPAARLSEPSHCAPSPPSRIRPKKKKSAWAAERFKWLIFQSFVYLRVCWECIHCFQHFSTFGSCNSTTYCNWVAPVEQIETMCLAWEHQQQVKMYCFINITQSNKTQSQPQISKS